MSVKKAVVKRPKFDPDEIPDLLARSRGTEVLSGKYEWMEALTPLEARDELLFRFQRLVASLVKVCLTGRYSSFNRSQIPFLRLFSNKDLQETATMLKRELSIFEPDELFRTGQLAILQAIERTEKNLAATVTTCFKDLIYSMIKGQDSHKSEPLEFVQVAIDSGESMIILEAMISDLPEGDWLLVQRVLEGEEVVLPADLVDRMREWFPEHC